MNFDLFIHSVLYLDGMGATPPNLDVGIRDGKIVQLGPTLSRDSVRTCIDARGLWVMPGMIDNHPHYDAELLMAPGLPESIRHGIATVCVGSCSLSTICSNATECADLFARVEAILHRFVRRALKDKHWSTPEQYAQHLNSLALGPNVVAFLGHSDLRSAIMGLDASTTKGLAPSPTQLRSMTDTLERALEAGFFGALVHD